MAKGKICKIEGCTNVLNITAGRICQMHRSRWHRNGSYDIPETSPYKKYHKPAITKLGYMRVNIDGKRVLEHRYIMEQHLGRELKPNERVHHINHIKTDNRIENLKLYKNNGEHMREEHGDSWTLRKTRLPYTGNEVKKIFDSMSKPSNPNKPCFCGKKFMARNLCDKHYQWVWKHKFI